eukprot:5779668-Pyramimonas_sp.AAC.1
MCNSSPCNVMQSPGNVAVHRRKYEKCGTARLAPWGGGIHTTCLAPPPFLEQFSVGRPWAQELGRAN